MGEAKEGRGGRPTKLNKTRQNAICDAYSIGCTQEMAATYAGLTVQTVKAWTLEGEKQHIRRESGEMLTPDEHKYAEFFIAITDAKLQAGIRWQQVIDNASNRDPSWALRMLQYRFPNEYKDPNRGVEVTGKDGADMAVRIVIEYADEDNTTTPA